MTKYNSARSGFTLIELMVTLALIAIMLSLAVPSLTAFQRNAELTSATNTLLSAVNAARSEAMKRGRYAMVVPADALNWSSGWIVFVDMNGTKVFDGTVDTTVMNKEAPPTYLTISGSGSVIESPPYVMFDASGYPITKANTFGNLTFTISRNDVASDYSQIRRLVIAKTGRVKTCKPLSLTDLNCPP